MNLNQTVIGVAGAGTMGAGIAQCCAAAGAMVNLFDANEAARANAMTRMNASAEKLHAKGKSPPAGEVMARIAPVPSLQGFAPCAFVIEAVFEDVAVKTALFGDLARVTAPDCVLASNTSSIPIAQLAAAVAAVDPARAKQVLGIHFMNPVPLMPLVEVVRPASVDTTVLARSVELVQALGKTAVTVADMPGFVANRVLMPYINEGFLLWEQNVADAAGIDTICKLGFNHPMGPLALADLIGLDVVLSILRVIHTQLGPVEGARFKPAKRLEELVAAGKLGRKSGAGVYKY
ncbi:MAG: 3-hydroxyacyl-CoA dehydrogenase family protein [Planctomycetota bacterium]